jgi:hypothetical protein
MSNNKPHGFCVTPELKCKMNYCDENGCMNRQRHLVGEPIEMSNNKQSIPEQGYYFCTLITGEFFSLYYDGINFNSQERTYKKEAIKTFIKILYDQQ